MHLHHPRHPGLVLLAALSPWLAACGGGDTPSSAGSTINLQTAHTDTPTRTFSITGWTGHASNTFSGTRTKTWSPSGNIELNGAPALQQRVSYIDSVTGAAGTQEFDFTETIDTDARTHAILTVSESGGPNVSPGYTVYEPYAPPVAVSAGQSGHLAAGVRYADNTLATRQSRFSTDYGAAADSDSSLLVTYTTTTYDNADAMRYQSTTVERVSASGLVTPVSSLSIGYAADGTTQTSSYRYTPQ